jgi:hypothetical protein
MHYAILSPVALTKEFNVPTLHPFQVVRSLAPAPFVLPNSLRRQLERLSGINYESVMARYWEQLHLENMRGPRPIETIVHKILRRMKPAMRLERDGGDFIFRDRPYLTRDILVISTFVQWFATGCGRCFLEDPFNRFNASTIPVHAYTRKLRYETEDRRPDLITIILHVCTSECPCMKPGFARGGFGGTCAFRAEHVSDRDLALVWALMKWLEGPAGLRFIKGWMELKILAQGAERDEGKIRAKALKR